MLEACDKIRQEWFEDAHIIKNVFQKLIEQNIKIFNIQSDISDFRGISKKKHYFIFVNTKNVNIEGQRFTILHELGHLLLNFDKSLSIDEEEILCNTFSSNILYSEKNLKKDNEIVPENRYQIMLKNAKNILEEKKLERYNINYFANI